MTRKVFSLTLALLMVFAAHRALAGGLGIGARYALVHMHSSDDNVGMPGAFVRLGDGLLGLEGTVDYRTEALTGGTKVKTWPITASVLLHPLPIVFAAAGLGWYNTTVDYPTGMLEDQTESTLGYQFGGGLQLPLAPTLNFVADARYNFIDYDFNSVPSDFNFNDADYLSLHGGLLLSLP